jgi:glucose/arabinose dehydrogenase
LDKFLGVDRQEWDRRFFDAVKNGVKGEDGESAGMVAFGGTLSDAQIWALVVHLRELQERDRRKRGGEGTLKPAEKGVFTTKHGRHRVERVITGGLATPWAVDWLGGPDGEGRMTAVVTEREGSVRVYRYDPAVGKAGKGELSEPIKGFPKVYANGQGGLMDVTAHPEYEKNGWVYVSYSRPGEGNARGGMTVLTRGKIKPGAGGKGLEWAEQEVLWTPAAEKYQTGGLHFGSRVVFGEVIGSGEGKGKRHVYLSLGERGRGDLSQDMTRPNGKLIRVYDDGGVPKDNPFVGQSGVDGAYYSFGHRNAQGMTIDLEGNLWVTEHGPRGGDELNLVKPGANYGWPLVTFGIEYSDAPLRSPWPGADGKVSGKPVTMPVWVWVPSIAACGLDTVRPGRMGEMFPKWKGDLVAGGLAGSVVERLRVKEGRVVEREEVYFGRGRVRDVVTGPEGSVWVVVNDPDEVVRLVQE